MTLEQTREQTRERDAAIKDMHASGLTAQDVAFEFDISLARACQILGGLGLARNSPTNERNVAICEAFHNGSSRDELASQFKLSHETICRVVDIAGMGEVRKGVSSRTKLRDARNAAIREAYRSGLTVEELAQQYNVSGTQIYNILRGMTP